MTASSNQPGARWTVRELLTWTSARFLELGMATDEARVDAEHLLAHALGCSRIDLYLQHARLVDEAERTPFRNLVRRRLAREPVAYIEGFRGFHALDLDLQVDRRVLIPRPETEHLVDWLLENLRPAPAPLMQILDVGTGSGAIALAVAKARYEVSVTAVDASLDALAVATANVERIGLGERIQIHRADLLRGVSIPPGPPGGFTAIAANLPYIPRADLDGLAPEVRDYEPRSALDGGLDGLDLVRELILQVGDPSRVCGGTQALSADGWLYLEIGVGQATEVEALLREAGFCEVDSRADYARIPRIVAGRRPR